LTASTRIVAAAFSSGRRYFWPTLCLNSGELNRARSTGTIAVSFFR